MKIRFMAGGVDPIDMTVRASARNPPVRTPVPAGYAALTRPTRSLFRKTPSPLMGEDRGGGCERL
jgi:hypothetical protein